MQQMMQDMAFVCYEPLLYTCYHDQVCVTLICPELNGLENFALNSLEAKSKINIEVVIASSSLVQGLVKQHLH